MKGMPWRKNLKCAPMGHGRLWVKVVVGGNSRDAALATPGKRTDFDGGLGIHREA